MPGLVIGGREFQVPGLVIRNFLDDPKLALSSEDGKSRSAKWVRSIFNHTTLGIPSVVGKPGWENQPQKHLPGSGPKLADATVSSWSLSKTSGGAHIVVGQDGEMICTADLLTRTTYHATSVNGYSIGVEWTQGQDASLYEDQMAKLVPLMDAITYILTELFESPIQRQIHLPFKAYNPVPRLANGGEDAVGIFGHRDQTGNRGPGDPGDWVAERLVAAGYEAFNFAKDTDKAAWKARQAELGVGDDGVPGPGTCAALRASGNASGLWVSRPGDAELAALYAQGANQPESLATEPEPEPEPEPEVAPDPGPSLPPIDEPAIDEALQDDVPAPMAPAPASKKGRRGSNR
jgi:hypothetical protein